MTRKTRAPAGRPRPADAHFGRSSALDGLLFIGTGEPSWLSSQHGYRVVSERIAALPECVRAGMPIADRPKQRRKANHALPLPAALEQDLRRRRCILVAARSGQSAERRERGANRRL